jgi:hypothetical protein
MKLIGYQVQSIGHLNDDAMYVVDGMLSLIEKGLPKNRTTVYLTATRMETHISIEGDEDFEGEGQVNIFAIIEADDSETLDEAIANSKELIREELHKEYELTGLRQLQLPL